MLMKTIAFYILAFAALTGKVLSQPNDALAKEKLKIFSRWTGHWKGEAFTQMGPGEPKKSIVDEHAELKLDGSIFVVEGIGKATDPATNEEVVVHHAYGILSFDQKDGEYKFKTYLKGGRSSDAWFKVIAENNYQWGFDVPNGKIRYSINIDDQKKLWNEIGEYSADGNNWMKFFTMNLTKVD